MKNFKIKPVPLLVIALLITGLFCCRKLEYSPYQTENPDRPLNLNAKNITKLMDTESAANDTVTILYIGDTHRFYDELNALVSHANTLPQIDFLVLAGDITDFGMLEQYLKIYTLLQKLNVPYICAIGNHDLTTNGADVYAHMFGEKNFSFTYKGYKFLFHDTNGREYKFIGNVPNIYWLTSQLIDTTSRWFIGVSHVPPYSTDFDKSLEYPYVNLFASKPNFILSLHGHLHVAGDSHYYKDGVRYMTCNSVEKKNSTLLTLINGNITKQMIPY